MSKDYYKILGVSKDADEGEIKKVWRKVRTKLHPDKGGDEAKFKEAKEAYDVLTDPQKRAAYDQFGTPDLNATRQRQYDPNIEDILRAAASAFGFGAGGGFGPANVDIINGEIRQKISVPVDVMLGGGTFNFTYVVPVAHGSISLQFRHSMGSMTIDPDTPLGHTATKEEFGQKMVLILIPESTNNYASQGLDVVTQAEVDVLRALAGESFEITHPNGTKLKIKPPASLNKTNMIRIPNKGLRSTRGARGDFLVALKLTVPSITDAQRRKLQELLKT